MPYDIDNPLKLVIERIGAAQRRNTLTGHQVLVAVHPEKGKVLLGEQPWAWEANAYQYYVVTPDSGVALPHRAAQLADLVGRRRTVEYLLIISGTERAQVADLVRELSRKPRPVDALAELVGGWLQEYIDLNTANNNSPLADFSKAVRERASAHVAERALARLGLRLTCAVDLPEEDIVTHLDVPMQALVHDCEETLDARVEVDLEKATRGVEMELIREHAQPKEEMEEHVRALAGRWFRAKCSLEDFCYGEERVREGLREALKSYLEEELKRSVTRLRVVCTPKFSTAFPHELCGSVACEVRPGATTIKVDHKLQIKRVNIADLRKQRIENLQQYVDQCLEKHTRNVFFGKQYVDVIVGFPKLSEEIEARVKPDMARIGFEATQLITLPDDPFVKRYIEGQFSFDTGAPDPPPAETTESRGDPKIFATKDPRITFGLSIAGRAKLQNYDRVRELNLITPRHDLGADFKRAAREAAAEVIRTLSPQLLYIQFHEPIATAEAPHDPNAQPTNSEPRPRTADALSPEQQIYKAVETRLGDEFNAKVESLNIRQEVTELSTIVDALQPADDHGFELKVQTAGADSPTEFKIAYRIQAIDPDGWLSLQKLCSGGAVEGVAVRAGGIVKAVMDRLKGAGTQQLRIFDRRLLSLPLQGALDYAQDTVFQRALKDIRADFGLVLKISLFDHDGMTPFDDEDIRYFKERLKLLREEALRLDYADPDVKRIETEMNRIKKEIEARSPKHDPYFKAVRAKLELSGGAKPEELPPPSNDPTRPDGSK